MSSQWHQKKSALNIHYHFAALSSIAINLFYYSFWLNLIFAFSTQVASLELF